MPTIPIIPGNAPGAGIGSLSKAKIKPVKNPVISANKSNFINTFLFHIMLLLFEKKASLNLINKLYQRIAGSLILTVNSSSL